MSSMSDLGYGFDPISPGSKGEASTFPSNSSYSMTSAAPSNGAGPSKRSGEDSQRDNGVAKEGSDGKQKKQKFTRSRTACLPVRNVLLDCQ